jgi:fatty acid desaturase
MLDRLHTFASRLRWLRPLSVLLGLISFFAAIFLLVQPDEMTTEAWFIPSLLVFCWTVLLYSFLSLFQVIPKRAGRDRPWRKRFMTGMVRAILYGLGLALLGLSIALVLMSYRLVNTGLG